MSRWRYIAGGLCLAFASFIIGSWIIADAMIAPAPSKVTWPSKLANLPENVTFQATDGIELKGWFLKQHTSTKAILLLHGVKANRESMLQRALWLHDMGYNVLLYDARGCGESAHVNRSFGYAETRDMLGALHWLQSRGMTQTGFIGTSQGASTIILASGQLPSDSVIVAEEPYATLRNTADDHFRAHTGLPSNYFGFLIVPMAEWRLGLRIDEVSPLQEIHKLKVPLYIVGGTSDVLAPPTGIHELYDAATCEKHLWIIPGAGHVDFFSYIEDQYKQRVGDFLRAHLSLNANQ